MSAQGVAQSVPDMAPPRPGDAIAWGTVDPKTQLLTAFTEKGPWFTLDMRDLGCCYFIGGDSGPIKIGWTGGPVDRRRRDLQCGSPVPLKVLAVAEGGRWLEQNYHFRFRDSRLHGEWFERTPEIITEIENLTANTSDC